MAAQGPYLEKVEETVWRLEKLDNMGTLVFRK
jgi:hypothetical protein